MPCTRHALRISELMQMPTPRHALLLAATTFVASLLPGATRAEAQDARGELLRRINAERQRAGAPALRLLKPLNDTAQQHAQEIARSGSLQLRRGSEEEMQQKLRKAGYNPHRWTESVTASTESLDDILREWRRRDTATWGSLMDPEVRDLGIGLARMRGVPLYTFLFAVPEAEHFARSTGGLRDAERVRTQMLAQVNELRRKAGAPPLELDPVLQKAAQAHAQDMLARGYFAHKSPSGTTVRERSRKAGYDWRTIGENIAEGQKSVDEVLTTWMGSPGHRKNILEPRFKDLGIGLVTGKTRDGEYRVIWVQNFGAK
jgi:uncharacterized protein YkwD